MHAVAVGDLTRVRAGRSCCKNFEKLTLKHFSNTDFQFMQKFAPTKIFRYTVLECHFKFESGMLFTDGHVEDSMQRP